MPRAYSICWSIVGEFIYPFWDLVKSCPKTLENNQPYRQNGCDSSYYVCSAHLLVCALNRPPNVASLRWLSWAKRKMGLGLGSRVSCKEGVLWVEIVGGFGCFVLLVFLFLFVCFWISTSLSHHMPPDCLEKGESSNSPQRDNGRKKEASF